MRRGVQEALVHNVIMLVPVKVFPFPQVTHLQFGPSNPIFLVIHDLYQEKLESAEASGLTTETLAHYLSLHRPCKWSLRICFCLASIMNERLAFSKFLLFQSYY